MKFRSAYTEHIRFPSPNGSRYRTIYQKNPEDPGRLIEVGVEDTYDTIQKAAVGHTMADIIGRLSAGDTSAVGPIVDTSDIDLTGAPKDMLEAHIMLNDAKAKYNQLPADLKSKFGNSFEQFLRAAADGSVYSVLQPNSSSVHQDNLSQDEVAKIREIIGGNNNA